MLSWILDNIFLAKCGKVTHETEDFTKTEMLNAKLPVLLDYSSNLSVGDKWVWKQAFGTKQFSFSKSGHKLNCSNKQKGW